jgi:hypothetical protein
VGALACEAPLAGGVGLVECVAGRAVLAPGLVAQLGVFRQGAGFFLDCDAGAAQVVSQQVEDAVLFSLRTSFHAHGDRLAAGFVVAVGNGEYFGYGDVRCRWSWSRCWATWPYLRVAGWCTPTRWWASPMDRCWAGT